MKKLIGFDIPVKDLKEYKDYINHLFRNDQGKFNICLTEEDVEKSNKWFSNFPKKTLIVSNGAIKKGDMFVSDCANQDLNMKVFKYIGISKKGVDLIDIEDEQGEKHLSTKHLLTNAMKIERVPTLAELKRVVETQSLDIKV